VLGTILGILFSGFVVGALARLAVPGPDPMPIWLTVAIGLGGSAAGGGIAYGAGARSLYVVNTAGFIAAIALVIAYRRFVQKRPLTGPEAMRFPERGFGIERQRERLQRLGVPLDPTAPGPVSRSADPDIDDLLIKLNELHGAGVLTDDEYRAKRELVLSRDEET
jgi:uncharacterized membrane protein YeaQ/YmgE (transglycosylase-associated protein family)